jgi:hypothetical protein
MCLNETYNTVCIGKKLSDRFLIQSGLKQGDALSPLPYHHCLITIAFQLWFGICHQGDQRELTGTETEWDTSAFGLY